MAEFTTLGQCVLGWLGQMGHIVTAISCFLLFSFSFLFSGLHY
jgi:hypothetical protein